MPTVFLVGDNGLDKPGVSNVNIQTAHTAHKVNTEVNHTRGDPPRVSAVHANISEVATYSDVIPPKLSRNLHPARTVAAHMNKTQ